MTFLFLPDPTRVPAACAPLVLMVFLLGMTGQPAHAEGEGAEPAPTALVEVAALKRQSMTRTVRVFGQVVADTRATTVISLPRAGQLARLQVISGQRIRKGAALAHFLTAPDLVAAFPQLEQTVKYARDELARNESLFTQQLITQSQLAAARKALTDAETAVQVARVSGNDRQEETLLSPFDAIVLATPANAGDRLPANAPLLQLARQDSQLAVLGITEEDRADVRPGLVCRISAVFGTSAVLQGRISEVSGQINKDTQLLDVQVVMAGSGVPIGTRVRADISVGTRVEWVVPRSAVLHDDQGGYVFQVHQGKAHRVPVAEGVEQSGFLAVRGALSPADAVVSLGNYELQDGMAVREAKH